MQHISCTLSLLCTFPHTFQTWTNLLHPFTFLHMLPYLCCISYAPSCTTDHPCAPSPPLPSPHHAMPQPFSLPSLGLETSCWLVHWFWLWEVGRKLPYLMTTGFTSTIATGSAGIAVTKQHGSILWVPCLVMKILVPTAIVSRGLPVCC